MYSFAQRSDTTVLDEPFYAVYLSRSKVIHPGADEVLASLPGNEEEAQRQVRQANEKLVLFVKNMAHHMEVLGDPFIRDAVNIFLIRDPKLILTSYAKVITTPVMRDIGVEYQYGLFSRLQEHGHEPIVLDSGLLLENPGVVLQKLCDRCSIPFEQRMVHWPKGPKPYDGVWAKYWYANVHQSTGFERQQGPDQAMPETLYALYMKARSFYEKLLPFSLKA
jgi:hypothetical protein